jgi:MFS superfamily sulfate permease-like transporter
MEFVWALVACAGVVVLGTLKGIVVAIIVSLVALAYQVAHPRVYTLGRKPGTDVFRPPSEEHPEDETFPGLLMVRPEGRIFFANAQHVGDQLLRLIEAAQPRVLALDFSAVFDIEYSALKMLTEAEERLRERGILLWLVALNPEALAMVQRSSLGETLGRERLVFNLQAAVERYLSQAGMSGRT